jgi:tetratricopeptide (TPR) repeat protein
MIPRSFPSSLAWLTALVLLLLPAGRPALAQKAKTSKGTVRAVELFNAGVRLQNQGQFDEAIEKYTEAIAAAPNDFQALANRGGVYRIKAIEVRESSAGLEPGPKAEAATQANELLGKSLADYDAALKASPKSDFIYHDRAAVYLASGKTDLALADYDEYVKRKPVEARAYNDRGTAYNEVAKLEKASEKAPEAGIKKATPTFDKAIADFTKTIELDPKFVLGYLNRASCYTQILKLDEALADYAKAIEISPEIWRAYRGRAEIYRALADDAKRTGDNAKAAEYTNLQKENTAKYIEIQSRPPVTPTPSPAPASAPKKK